MCRSSFCAAAQAVTLEAERDYAAGEAVAMDYGLGKLDSQVLLDHGVLDADSPQARLPVHSARPALACLHALCCSTQSLNMSFPSPLILVPLQYCNGLTTDVPYRAASY